MSWASCFLFAGMNTDEIGQIEPHVKSVSYEPGQTLMVEGEPGDSMIILESGSVKIFKKGIEIAERSDLDTVGLMALVEMCPRSATVVAGSAGVTGYTIDQTAWQSFMKSDLQSTLLHNYLIYQQNTIRQSDLKRLEGVREKLRQEKMRVLSARFFVQMIIGLVIFTFTLGTLKTWFEEFDSTITGFGVLIVYAIGSAMFVYQSGLPLENFGFTTKNFKSAMRFMMPMTALFIGGMFLFKWGLTTWAPESFGTEVVAGYQAGELKISLWLMLLLYCVHAMIQEFIARGCVQGGLHQFIVGKGAATMAIVLSTMIFSVIHLIMNFNFAVLTIAPGLFWGYLFYKQRNFWAVGISHILIGATAFFILGFS